MRTDVSSVQAKLGGNEFAHRDFSDTFADMNIWPIYAALLTDARVVGRAMSPLDARATNPPVPAPAPAPTSAPSGLFDRYDTAGQGHRPQRAADLRAFLRQLSHAASHEGQG